MPDPKRLRLLKVTPEGCLVGSGEARKNTHVLIPHEALPHGEGDPVALQALVDACRYARRLIQGIAWRLGVCSWDNTHRAIPKDNNPFHQSD